MSLVEAVSNVLVGFGVAVLAQLAVFPRFDLDVSIKQTVAIGLIFTAVSVCRSYAAGTALRASAFQGALDTAGADHRAARLTASTARPTRRAIPDRDRSHPRTPAPLADLSERCDHGSTRDKHLSGTV
jgi:hypothetical protein